MIRRLLPALLLALPSVALAGRQPFNEVLDNEILPARGAEWQTRITDVVGTPGGDDETAVLWAAALGLSPHFELVLPAEVAYSHADGTTQFTWYAAEIRWRMAKPGPPPPPWHPVPLLRLSVERNIADEVFEGGVDLAIGTDLTRRLHSSLSLGGIAVSNGEEAAIHGGLGLTGNVTDALRVGGEVFGELPVIPSGEAPSVAAGPDVSFTLGQFWVTAGSLFGLGEGRAFDASARLAWGIEF